MPKCGQLIPTGVPCRLSSARCLLTVVSKASISHCCSGTELQTSVNATHGHCTGRPQAPLSSVHQQQRHAKHQVAPGDVMTLHVESTFAACPPILLSLLRAVIVWPHSVGPKVFQTLLSIAYTYCPVTNTITVKASRANTLYSTKTTAYGQWPRA